MGVDCRPCAQSVCFAPVGLVATCWRGGSEEPRLNGDPRWVGPGAFAPPCLPCRSVWLLGAANILSRCTRTIVHDQQCTPCARAPRHISRASHRGACPRVPRFHVLAHAAPLCMDPYADMRQHTPNAASFISARGAACRRARARSLECNDVHSHVLHASCAEVAAGPVQNHDAGVTGNLGIVHDPMPADMTCLAPHASCGRALAHGAWGVREIMIHGGGSVRETWRGMPPSP